MDLRDVLYYFKKSIWILIISIVLCTAVSGFFSYFNKYSYLCTPKIIVGPQTQVNRDTKFVSNIVNVLAELTTNDEVLDRLLNETGLNMDKETLKTMISTDANDVHQRIYFIVTGSDQEAVRVVADKIPDIISDAAMKLFGIDNLMIVKSEKVVINGKSYRQNIISGSVAGLGIGIMIIFLLMTFDKKLWEKKALQRLYNLDYLGSLKQKGDDTSILSTKLILKAKNNDTKTAAIIPLDVKDDKKHINQLVKTLASMGRKVLVIGKDLYNKKSSEGSLSIQNSDISKLIEEADKNIHYVSFDPKDNITASDIIKLDIKSQLESVKDCYDLILLSLSKDTGADKMLLLSHSFGSIIAAAEKNSTNIKNAEELTSNLKDTDINILGYYVIE
ncbi:chain length determinant protein [Oxobacter pfennigii]|uniref:Chain length determinant protein n=1 Tax=Oxobacter pfennigii TaxID=36849 RepID=A0A0P8WS18_9CLOT|nr:hypothetical protein [Oxobacter pfennigii]KPU45365.1 chain length determinant protein [Oxobacter pfennigii]